MARIKLDPPRKVLFSDEIPVRITDINYGGHLGNDAMLSILHEARMRFLMSKGWSEKSVEGSGLIMADAAVVFKSEAFHGEILEVEMGVDDLSNIGFDILYSVVEKSSRRQVAAAKTGMVFFDYERKRLGRVPDTFKPKLGLD